MLLSCLVALGASGADAQAPAKTDAADEAGFVSMFNGKDFSGWHFGGNSYALPTEQQKVWAVGDGVIKQVFSAAKPQLLSQWDYEDFELRLEWRVMAGEKDYNSGVFIRCTRDNEKANQINLKKGGEGELVNPKVKGSKAIPELLKPSKEWNEWCVRAVGDKISLTCNGKPAWDVTGYKSLSGCIGLQAEYFPFEFRNLRIKDLGYEALNNPAAWATKGWSLSGDALVAGGATEPLVSKASDYKDYRLRLEWRAAKDGNKGALYLRGPKAAAAAVALGAGGGDGPLGQKAPKNPDNPVGQWNYLDATVQAGKAKIWLNGVVLAENVALEQASGAFSLSTGLEYRNIRVKRLDAK